MKLRTKFHLASAGLILIVVIGMMTSLFIFERKQLESDVERAQLEDLTKLAQVSDEISVHANELTLLNYAQALVKIPKFSYAGFVHPDGSGWLVTSKQGFKLTESSDPLAVRIVKSRGLLKRNITAKDGEHIIEVSKPVKGKGYVRLGYSKDVVTAEFNALLWKKTKRFSVAGFIAILFGLFLAQLMSRALSRPILLLMKAAEEIGQGKKGVIVPVQTSDEIGHLTHTFNAMSQDLGKLDMLKDDFMSHVTHELRSPLTSIIATVELLAENPIVRKDAKMTRSVDRLTYGSERLNRLVDNILDLTRLEAGKMHFDIQPIEIGNIVGEMADFFEPRAMERNLQIRANAPKRCPLAKADPEKIRQVLSNLIHNAIKFTNAGEIVLSVRKQGDWVQVSVQDTGVGIPKDKLGSVFGKFETLQDTRDRVNKPVPGSGLGLNIVKNSIEAQGGKIWVESEVDKGTTFIFQLPLAEGTSLSKPKDTLGDGSRHVVMLDDTGEAG